MYSHSSERIEIEDPDAVGNDDDDLLLREFREYTADGFERQAEVVADVLPRERQIDPRRGGADARPAVAEAVEKARHLLVRRLAAQEDHVVLRRGEFAGAGRVHSADEAGIFVEQ